MTSSFVFFKELATDTTVTANLQNLLETGELVQDVQVNDVRPTTDTELEITVVDVAGADLKFVGGEEGVSYGANLVVTTDRRTFTCLLAVSVRSESALFNPYYSSDPDAFKDLVGTIQAGDSALGTAVFSFPQEFDPRGGYVTWAVLGEDQVVYNEGNAFDYQVTDTGFDYVVVAKAVISFPSDLQPTVDGSGYQIRWTLHKDDTQSYLYETVIVDGESTVPLGTQPGVELQGNVAKLELVTQDIYDNVSIQIYTGNDSLGDPSVLYSRSQPGSPVPMRVGSGWYYAGAFDTGLLRAAMSPYTVIWRYYNDNDLATQYTERADLWVINPSILTAVEDVLAKVAKARTTLYGRPDLLYPTATVLTWLRRAADAFNGYMGVVTRFSFLNATGGIREYWLLLAELYAIRSQYLAEGEKAFDFQGAAIQLSVDQTQYLDAAASAIQSRLDNELKPFKQNLVIRGQTDGDGDGEGPLSGRKKYMGGVGITITALSDWGGSSPDISRE